MCEYCEEVKKDNRSLPISLTGPELVMLNNITAAMNLNSQVVLQQIVAAKESYPEDSPHYPTVMKAYEEYVVYYNLIKSLDDKVLQSLRFRVQDNKEIPIEGVPNDLSELGILFTE